MGIVKPSVKLFVFAIVVLSYFLLTLPIYPFMIIYPHKTSRILMIIIQWYSKFLLWHLNIEVDFCSDFANKGKNYYIVSNHLSYLDVMIICSQFPACFVTSREIKETFFLGLICTLAGCLFVERRNRSMIDQEVKSLAVALSNGLSVVVFPEATSSNGEDVLDFKRTLFKAPIMSETEILPLTINYTNINHQIVGPENKDYVFWYGDMTFINHFFNALKLKKVKVRIDVHKPFGFINRPESHKEVAKMAHQMISNSFSPVL